MYVHIADSLCCTRETNTILLRNYTPIKNFFKEMRKEREKAFIFQKCIAIAVNPNTCFKEIYSEISSPPLKTELYFKFFTRKEGC